MTAILSFVLVVETAAVELLLRRFGLPDVPRLAILALGVSSVLGVLGVMIVCARRPHVVSQDGLRLRYGPFFTLDVPAELIASARLDRRFDEKRLLSLSDGELAVAVASQTNVVVELREPLDVPRPQGRARRLRFFADDPSAALRAIAQVLDSA
ncbi:hypothetical protein [Microbispora sp. H10885]|uniref:hypothetical protein n=1 Tax=Microbispora sp. H10885 TaxID=2729110 RepID=UPI0016014792|nr:hypothetical protein [Microbispora sp. H10885]